MSLNYHGIAFVTYGGLVMFYTDGTIRSNGTMTGEWKVKNGTVYTKYTFEKQFVFEMLDTEYEQYVARLITED